MAFTGELRCCARSKAELVAVLEAVTLERVRGGAAPRILLAGVPLDTERTYAANKRGATGLAPGFNPRALEADGAVALARLKSFARKAFDQRHFFAFVLETGE